MLKENGYQDSMISKIFKRITNLPQSQQQKQTIDIQGEKIRMCINSFKNSIKGTTEKARRVLRTYKISCNICLKNNLHKLLCKL